MMTKIVLVIFIIFSVLDNVSSLFRMTKMHCESYNNSSVVVNECRLRPISRGVTKGYINVTVLQAAFKVDLSLANGYKSFLINLKFNCCEYVVRRNNPTANLIFAIFKNFSNINHPCPFVGTQYLDGFYLKHEQLHQLPLPDGEYGLMMTWDLNKRKSFSTDVYFEYKMN